MNNIEKNKFKKQLYKNITTSISECLKDLDNKKQLELLLTFLQGYFDAKLDKLEDEIKDNTIYVKIDLLGGKTNE